MNMPDKENWLGYYRTMQLIREFETTLDELFGSGAISGTSHLCIGQEACAVGAIATLQPDDLVTSNHRGHGHFLAKNGDPLRMMAELFGKTAGYSGGRGGSQHMADMSIGFLGSNGITAGMIPVATGAALSQKILKTGRVTLCFFGDGASGQGAFYEAVNMGATWELPVVYFCENNQYAMSTATSEAFREPSVAKRCSGIGLKTCVVDGNDFFAVYDVVSSAVNEARGGQGPTLIEAYTYRHCGHSKSDRCEYRSGQEEQEWLQRDPITRMRQTLLEHNLVSELELSKLEQEVKLEIQSAVVYADGVA